MVKRVSVCEVCGEAFVWIDQGIPQTRCRKHRQKISVPRRGYYAVITFCDGLTVDQEDFLARMIDRRLTARMLRDFLVTGTLHGAVVQHLRTKQMYKVDGRRLVKLDER